MSHPRYFTNKGDLKYEDAAKELKSSLTTIILNAPPQSRLGHHITWHFSGLYDGPTSIAYLFLRLCGSHSQLRIEDKTLHEWCLAYLELGKHPDTGRLRPSASNCGVAHERLAHTAVLAAATNDANLAEELCTKWLEVVAGDVDGGSDEWLYGRSGFLYVLRIIKHYFIHDATIQVLVETATKTVVERILRSPRPWTWHGKEYLGAVHGAIGIILQVVLSYPLAAPLLEDVLVQCLDTQLPSGNFPSSIPYVSGNPHSDRLVQLCHGAPGFIISLVSLRPFFTGVTRRIGEALFKARECVWTHGLLVKEPCLCHGIAGNALSFEDETRLRHFLALTCQSRLQRGFEKGLFVASDSPYSLFCGEGGRAWAWAVADCSEIPPCACIGLNDL